MHTLCAHAHKHTHALTHTQTRTHRHTHTHARTHACTHTHTHTHGELTIVWRVPGDVKVGLVLSHLGVANLQITRLVGEVPR